MVLFYTKKCILLPDVAFYLLSFFVGIRPMIKKSEEKKATKAVSERLSRSQFQHMIATKAEAIKYTVFFIPQKIKLLISVAKIRLHAEILLPSIKKNFIFSLFFVAALKSRHKKVIIKRFIFLK